MILMIDNFDSFTYNIVQYLQQLQQQVMVKQNNQLTLADISSIQPDAIVIGPGPKRPEDAGISLNIIKQFAGHIPILGICLGHQAIGQAFGSHIIQAANIMHGRTSAIYHQQHGVFTNLPAPFLATRYHSLVIDKSSLPDTLELTAWTQTTDGQIDEIMGIRHRQFAIEGVQFHPESILSDSGLQLLQNFLQQYVIVHAT